MATQREGAEFSNTHNNDNIRGNSTSQQQDNKKPANSHFSKAIAHRALYGSVHRGYGSRNIEHKGIRSLPSRLSKVSLANDNDVEN